MVQKVVPADAILIPDSAERVFKGIIYDVYHWQQELYDGSKTTFEMLRRPDTVAAICVVDDKIVVLQDEQPHRGLRTTFPGGRTDGADQDTLTAIQREVHEETGYTFKNWRLVQVMQPHTKIEQFVYVYIAWDGEQADAPHTDAGERIVVELLSFDEVRKLVDGKVGYMGESQDLFESAGTLEALMALPEFQGKEVSLRG
jgi:ADP-ribose pyrophosphatase